MATKNEKSLAQAILGMSDLLSLLKPQILEQIELRADSEIGEDGVVPNHIARLYDLVNNNPFRAVAEEILAQEETAPVSAKSGVKSDDRYYYTGLEVLDMTQEQRDALKVCEFTVKYHGEIILDVFWDTKLEWILKPNENKTAFDLSDKRSFRGINAKFKGSAMQYLKQLADAEREKPGTFAELHYHKYPVTGHIKL